MDKDNFHLEVATQADLLQVQEIGHTIYPIAYGKILSPRQIDYMLDKMYSIEALTEKQVYHNEVFMLLRSAENELAGFVSYQMDYPQARRCRIHKIYLLPAFQGMGLGAHMLEQIIEIARQYKMTHLNLNVNRYNEALGFYQHLGFEIILEEDIPIGQGYFMNDYQMEKEITTE